MSTNDVPGADKRNGDELAMGCWAEHADGSYVFVESTEGANVVYSMFDIGSGKLVEYRDMMPLKHFEKRFSTTAKGAKPIAGIKWIWHDKTPFPWDKVIDQGASDGVRHPSASDQLSAARLVADSLNLRGRELDGDALQDRKGKKGFRKKVYRFLDQLDSANRELRE